MRPTPCAVAAIATLALTPLVHAEMVVIGADRDNTIFDKGGTSNGAGDYLFAGQTAANRLRRGLIHFDVASAVPAGATVTDVTLTLHLSRSISGPFDVTVHRALADWGEAGSDAPNEEGSGAPAETGDATWNYAFFSTDPWANAGGDFEAFASATESIGGVGFYDWTSDQLIADVQSFLDGPGGNFGWFLLGAEDNIASTKRFDTRENPNVAMRPALSVTYVAPAPGALPVLALVAVAGRRRRRG